MRSLTAGVGLVLCALAIVACAGAENPSAGGATSAPPRAGVPLGEAFTLEVGQTAELEGGGLRVRYAELLHDSRCPPDVACVWAGDAVVRVSLAGPGFDRTASVRLHTYDGRQLRADYAGYRIELRGVARDGATATFVLSR